MASSSRGRSGASTPQSSKRKALALTEVVSNGTPQKLFAQEGQCHRIFPQAKPHNALQVAQVGVERTLACDSETPPSHVSPHQVDPASLVLLQRLARAAVADAFERHEKKLIEKVLVRVYNRFGVTLRSLIAEWTKCSPGKMMLESLTNALNKSYSDGKIKRRVVASDILQELKQLIKGAEKVNDQSETMKALLLRAEDIIMQTASMPGDEFVALLRCYLQANQQVHVEWSERTLQDAVDEAKKGELNTGGEKRTNWINKMALDIAQTRGWLLEL